MAIELVLCERDATGAKTGRKVRNLTTPEHAAKLLEIECLKGVQPTDREASIKRLYGEE